jgi:hypothetical protein
MIDLIVGHNFMLLHVGVGLRFKSAQHIPSITLHQNMSKMCCDAFKSDRILFIYEPDQKVFKLSIIRR